MDEFYRILQDNLLGSLKILDIVVIGIPIIMRELEKMRTCSENKKVIQKSLLKLCRNPKWGGKQLQSIILYMQNQSKLCLGRHCLLMMSERNRLPLYRAFQRLVSLLAATLLNRQRLRKFSLVQSVSSIYKLIQSKLYLDRHICLSVCLWLLR